MDVTLPNGKVIRGVPEGTSKEDIKAKAISSGLARAEDFGDVPRETLPEGSGNYARDITRQALQGLTFGFSDEIGAGVAAGMASLLDDADFSEAYKDIRDSVRRQDKGFAEKNKKAAMAANIAGGLLSGGAGAVRTGAAKTLPRLAGYGAATGGVTGLGTSQAEDVAGMATDTGVGALTGATLGTAVPMIGRGVGRAAQRMFRPDQGQQVGSAVQSELNRSGVLASEAQKRLQANPNLVLGDLSENLQNRTAALSTMPGRAAETARDVLETRTTEQAKRIMPEIRQGLGADAKYYEALPQLTKDMSAKAKPLYEKAYQTEITRVPKNVGDVIREARQNGALRGAEKLASAELKKFEDLPTFQGLDYLKRSLQDLEGAAIRSGKGQLASGFTQQRKAIGDYLKAKSPEYREANKIWSSGNSDKDAMEAGLKALRNDADFNRTAYNAMSQSEQKAFKVGLMQALQNKVGTMAEDRNIVRQLQMIPKNRELLKMAFGNEKSFKKFMDKLSDENAMFETFAKSQRGSRTMPLAQGQAAVRDLGQGALSAAMTGSPMAALPAAFRQVTGRMGQPLEARNEPFRGALSDALLDNRQGQQVLQQLLARNPNVGVPALAGAGPAGVLAQRQ